MNYKYARMSWSHETPIDAQDLRIREAIQTLGDGGWVIAIILFRTYHG